MKNIFDHIEYVKGKPHHIRKRVALATATAASAFIGLIWLGTNLATGSFAIQGSNFAASTGQEATVTTVDQSGDIQGLAGAGAAPVLQSADAPAHIEIVDTTPAPAKAPDATILPF
jgi:hypothetical protein